MLACLRLHEAVAPRLCLLVAMAWGGVSPAAWGQTTAPIVPTRHSHPAWPLYERLCLPCHGATGDGRGPAAMLAALPPRDLTRGVYKWRSTPSGRGPTEADIVRTIARGVPGTSMPAFGETLGSEAMRGLAALLRSLSPRLRNARAAEPVRIVPAAASPGAQVDRGRGVYERLGCATCHGETLRGDGPEAGNLRDDAGRPSLPYDLTRVPPRGGSAAEDLARSIITGLDGTPMPSYEAALGAGDLDALVGYLGTVVARSAPVTESSVVVASRSAAAIPALPQAGASAADYEAELTFWRLPLAVQGEPPAHLPPAARSASAERCARCHARQYRDWSTSLHARGYGPGFAGQMIEPGTVSAPFCQSCHAPLGEQQIATGSRSVAAEDLRAEAVNCAACHLREWVRHGPPGRGGGPGGTDAARLPIGDYPLRRLAMFERSDFCLPCHQHRIDTPGALVQGKPLLDTYREWLQGPYFTRGVQCQNCHMPDREHTWRGAHDPRSVRQALRIDLTARRRGERVEAELVIENEGCGHAFPTTPTPAAFVRLVLLDESRRPLADTEVRFEIRRGLAFRGGRWQELFDHRIAPGAQARVQIRRAVPAARAARATIEMRPDYLYEGFYEQRLARTTDPEARRLFGSALEAARRSPFVLFDRTIAIQR